MAPPLGGPRTSPRATYANLNFGLVKNYTKLKEISAKNQKPIFTDFMIENENFKQILKNLNEAHIFWGTYLNYFFFKDFEGKLKDSETKLNATETQFDSIRSVKKAWFTKALKV